MDNEYFCRKCGTKHSLDSPEGIAHFPKSSEEDPFGFLEFIGTAGTWEFVRQGLPGLFEGSAQYANDVEVFRRLNEEFFRNQAIFASPESAHSYVSELGIGDFGDLPQHVQNKIQGAIGEVAHLRQRQESLRYWFNSLTEGNAEMIDGTSFDLLRLKTQAFQTKASLAGSDPGHLARRFAEQVADKPAIHLNGNEFVSRDIVFGANKEVLDSPAGQSLTNPKEQVGTADELHNTGERLVGKMNNGHAYASLLVPETLIKICQGAAIGAAISGGISTYMAYSKYKAGDLSFDEALTLVGKEVCKGAVVGGALSGLSLIIPGGIIGLGLGIVVGKSLRDLIDVAYGDGSYKMVLQAQRCVVISIQRVVASGAMLACVVERDQQILNVVRENLRQGQRQDSALDRGMALLERKLRRLKEVE